MDTSGEHANSPIRGLQHKYEETALVLTTQDCAMFCRHCFRRRLVGKESDEIAVDVDRIVEYIQAHPRISNVLLSGGDSFMQPTERIRQWLDRLSSLETLDFIRFGTRTPVTFPQRILSDPELIEVLQHYTKTKKIYVVSHFNHPGEITPQSVEAVKMLQNAGVTIKNQTVLMRGVNDSSPVLAQLLRKMTALGIIQHYIFQCRPALGVKSRFQVPLAEGSDIVQKALATQNGLGKSADYTMSHVTGKIRILGKADDGKMVFQYKQAKDPAMIGRIFSVPVDDEQTWLPYNLF